MSSQTIDPFLDKTSGPVVAEAGRYVRIQFHVELASQTTTTIHWADCGIDTAISGLKEDLQNVLTLPVEQQIWTLRSRILEDNNTLADYGLTGTESSETSRCGIQIYVKRRQ